MRQPIHEVIHHLVNGGFFLQEAVEMVEKGMIESTLERTGGNRSEASKRLGIHRNTLQRKMAEYKIEARPIERRPARGADGLRRKAAAG